MTVVKCSSHTTFLRLLHHMIGVPWSGQWFFRGQARASWPMKPSLFRDDEIKDRKAFEKATLENLRKSLDRRSMVPQRYYEAGEDGDNYVLALAQHYGCPTRLLDWTSSPEQAAYFAVADAIRLGRAKDDDPIAVYAVARIGDNAVHLRGSKFFAPPSVANDNLAAQKGHLMKVNWDCTDLWLPQWNDPVVHDEAPSVSPLIHSRFIRFELPFDQAAKLCMALDDQEFDGFTAFPGMHGHVRAAMDHAWYDQRGAEFDFSTDDDLKP